MRKKPSRRAVTSLAGATLAIIALLTAGCASSKPQGALSFGEEWRQMNQRLRDGGPLSDRGQEINRSLDSSRFDGPQR